MATKKQVDDLIKRVRDQVEKPLVTANFHDRWKEYAKDNLTLEQAVEIAWLQGRYAILLEKALRANLETVV